MARTFVTIGLPTHRPFRLWLADRVDELAAIHPSTGEPVHGQEIADMSGELVGLLRSADRKFSTETGALMLLSDYLQTLGQRFQGTDQGAFAEIASYMGLWLEELSNPAED
jgi:hypothetical protein